MDIFGYSDYRLLLKDLYCERKLLDPKFSYRYIAMHAGFKSAGFFSQVLQGKSNISLRIALSLGKVFKLKGPELEYFENLVHLNQAKNQADRQHFFGRLLSLKQGKPRTLESGQYELFTKWYYLAVHELLSFIRFKDDYKELADTLVPRISVAEAKDAVKVLERLGLVRRHNGHYERVDAALTTGDAWKSLAITQFQLAALDLAKQSYDSVPGRHRSHSTLTLSLSESEFRRIREDITQMRKKILELARNSPSPDRVYQITFNVYPLSRFDGA
jgi:uncharacterized protein (TIGR02147 family)